MAKKKVAAKADDKAAKKAANQEKYNTPNENFRTINTTEMKVGKTSITVTTQVCHVRGKGCMVREITSTGSITSYFVAGVKIKKKKEWLNVVEDKGPKVKKDKK